MLDKTFSLLFYLKKPKNYNEGTMPIYLRITVDGIPKEFTAKRDWLPSRWNANSGRAMGSKEDAKTLNGYLDVLQNKVYQARQNLIEKNQSITSELLKNNLVGIKDRPRMLIEIFEEHNRQMAELVGKEFSRTTLIRYKTSISHTRSFLKWKFNVSDIDVLKLNFEFVSDYAFYLKAVRNCNHNSTLKYISNFRKIVYRCLQYGWLPKDPFIGFRMKVKAVERIPLSEQELSEIWNKQFVSERVRQVRDIFLFCCYTGLCYADIKKLKRSEIGLGIDGEKWIFTSRQKTDTSSRIPVLPIAVSLLNKYKDNPKCLNEDRALPVLSNQKMNSYLKEIADLCQINRNLTFHMARHTFATTVTLSNGVPIETISKMLGHKSIRTTQIYAKILDLKVSEDMQSLRTKLGYPPRGCPKNQSAMDGKG
jgi:site-specific recombinase XerD